MLYPRIMAAALLLSIFAVPDCIAASGQGRMITVDGLENDSVGAATEPGPGAAPVLEKTPEEAGLLTVKGIVTAVDPAAHTIVVNTESGEKTFSFDEGTRFQSGLRPIDTAQVEPGSRIAVLYDEKGGSASLKRVMLVPARTYGPTKGTYKSRRHHNAKSHKAKSRKAKSRKAKAHGHGSHKKKPSGRKKGAQ